MKESQQNTKYLDLTCSGLHVDQGAASSVCWLLGTGSLQTGLDCLSSLELLLSLRVRTLHCSIRHLQHSLTGTDRQRQTGLVLISRLLYKVIVVHMHTTQLDTLDTHSYTFELLVVNGLQSVSSTGFTLLV